MFAWKMMDMESVTELSTAAFLRSHVNRRLSAQNCQLSSNCERLRKNLEKMQLCNQNKIENDKTELQRYQEKLLGTTGNFISSAENFARTNMRLATPRTPGAYMRPRRMSIATSVCTQEESKPDDQEEKPVDQEQNSRSKSFSDLPSFKKGTLSSQHKRLLRRKSSVSLLELQKLNANIKDITMSDKQKTYRGAFAEEPVEEHGRFTQDEEEEAIKIPPSVFLPPIHTQVVTQLKERKFEKDQEFKMKISGEGEDEEELKYCRYLRRPCRLRRGLKTDFQLQKYKQRQQQLNARINLLGRGFEHQ